MNCLQLQAEEYQRIFWKPLEPGKRGWKILPYRVQGEHGYADTLILDFCEKIKFPPLVCHGSHRKLIQMESDLIEWEALNLEPGTSLPLAEGRNSPKEFNPSLGFHGWGTSAPPLSSLVLRTVFVSVPLHFLFFGGSPHVNMPTGTGPSPGHATAHPHPLCLQPQEFLTSCLVYSW